MHLLSFFFGIRSYFIPWRNSNKIEINILPPNFCYTHRIVILLNMIVVFIASGSLDFLVSLVVSVVLIASGSLDFLVYLVVSVVLIASGSLDFLVYLVVSVVLIASGSLDFLVSLVVSVSYIHLGVQGYCMNVVLRCGIIDMLSFSVITVCSNACLSVCVCTSKICATHGAPEDHHDNMHLNPWIDGLLLAVRARVRTCVRACVRVCPCVRVCVCVHVCLRTRYSCLHQRRRLTCHQMVQYMK